jgi:C-terminal processing protease CtpA/Prc
MSNGISIQVPDETGSKVIEVYSGGPAEKADCVGDIITIVNGTEVANLTLDAVLACFDTTEDAANEITFLHDGVENTISIVSAEIHINRVISTCITARSATSVLPNSTAAWSRISGTR